MTPAEILAAARDVLRERGHCKFNFEDPDTGAVCAWGAINVAATGDPVLLTATAGDADAAITAYRLLSAYTSEEFGHGAFWWNDLDSTSLEDVHLG